MRFRSTNQGLSVHAIAGTNVVVLGLDLLQPDTAGLLGLALHRADHTENEQYWMRGFKTFEATYPSPPPGSLVSTREHPLQTFLWGDYTAKPDHKYTYTVVPLRGKPANLVEGPGTSVDVATESEDEGTHAVFFNRGVIGSQAYASKFHNLDPRKEKPDGPAHGWLSRGLEEAMKAFILQAKGKGFGLRAAVYEFNWRPVLETFRSAGKSGADVRIIYDNRKGGPGAATKKAIAEAKLKDAVTLKERKTETFIAHNKFIVLLKNDKPIEVWTGSTNITESGIFGQLNVGHIVRDAAIAHAYLDYWNRLSGDPRAKDLRRDNLEVNPDPDGPPPANSVSPFFSPRTGLDLLQWYADRFDAAEQVGCFTGAFGINKRIASKLETDEDHLRYVVLEKAGSELKLISRDRDVRIAVGAILEDDALTRWLKEQRNPLGEHVFFIHTKFMLIDPVSDDPIVISGSANFSDASTSDNDENMLVIRGDKRVADIYLGEFMRIFNHFYFRDVANRLAAQHKSQPKKATYLQPDDSWTKPYYVTDSPKERQRLLFR